MTIASANINYGYLQNESLGTVSRKSLLNSFASGTWKNTCLDVLIYWSYKPKKKAPSNVSQEMSGNLNAEKECFYRLLLS